MTTATGHTRAITASRVAGTTVYDTRGETIGHVEDVVLDKTSDRILFAVLGFGGFLGIGEKVHAMPWSMLDYDETKGGYVVALDPAALEQAPAYVMSDLLADDGAVGRSLDYYARLPH